MKLISKIGANLFVVLLAAAAVYGAYRLGIRHGTVGSSGSTVVVHDDARIRQLERERDEWQKKALTGMGLIERLQRKVAVLETMITGGSDTPVGEVVHDTVFVPKPIPHVEAITGTWSYPLDFPTMIQGFGRDSLKVMTFNPYLSLQKQDSIKIFRFPGVGGVGFTIVLNRSMSPTYTKGVSLIMDREFFVRWSGVHLAYIYRPQMPGRGEVYTGAEFFNRFGLHIGITNDNFYFVRGDLRLW